MKPKSMSRRKYAPHFRRPRLFSAQARALPPSAPPDREIHICTKFTLCTGAEHITNNDSRSSPVRSSWVKSPNLQKCLQLCHTQFFSPEFQNQFIKITLYQASGNDHRYKISHWWPQMSEATKSHLHLPSRIPNSVGYMAIQRDTKSLPTDLFLTFLDLLDLLALLALKRKHFFSHDLFLRPCWYF